MVVLKLIILLFGIYPIIMTPLMLAGTICSVFDMITESNFKTIYNIGISCLVSYIIFIILVFSLL